MACTLGLVRGVAQWTLRIHTIRINNQNQLINQRLDRPTGRYTLPDYGHDLTEYILGNMGYTDTYVNAHHLPDTIVAWVSGFTMCFVLAHPRRFLIIRRALIIFAILFFFRAFTVTVTSLPDASPVCRAQFLNGAAYKSQPMFPRSFIRAFRFMLSPTTVRTDCFACLDPRDSIREI